MSHLLLISIGPVQDFIAAARRTRDLWFGSHVLSEISKAAAQSLQQSSALLIFPAPQSEEELSPGSDLNVANKILAEVPDSLTIEQLVTNSRKAAQDRWSQFADEAHKIAQDAIREEIWQDQVQDVVEFYAAWTPLQTYCESRERVERLLAGRKALRNFIPAHGKPGIPKSSLDGARESVLKDPKGMSVKLRRKTRLKETEQLDAVALVKRLAGDPENQFVSVARIAYDSWIRGIILHPQVPEKLQEIDRLCDGDFSSKIKDENFRQFPRDSEILSRPRIQSFLRNQDLQEYREALREIDGRLKYIQEKLKLGEPSPYFAVLAADGDRMGKAIAAIDSPEHHRRFSRQLSQFAGFAREIVRKHHGCLVYSGGDDVLAFLPLDTCLPAARELHDTFGKLMNDIAPDTHPTLSVGIGIGHCLEPLEQLLNLARAAEKMAKKGVKQDGADDRDGIAIHLQTRANATLKIRARWQDNLDKRLHTLAEMLASDSLPDGLAYDLRGMAEEYRDWQPQPPPHLLQADARRLLGKKRSRGKPLADDKKEAFVAEIQCVADITRLATELLLGRHVAEAIHKTRISEVLQKRG